MNLPIEKIRLINKPRAGTLQRNYLLDKLLANLFKNKNENSNTMYKNENVRMTKGTGH